MPAVVRQESGMGLLDQVIGSVTGGKGGSMSPLTKALLLLLAAKAASSYFGKGEAKPADGSPAPAPAPSGKIESGVLAGLPSLDSLLSRLRSSGLEEKVDSWIGKGENKEVAPAELDRALGPGTLDELSKQTGMPKEALLKELSGTLPQVIDKLTPDGKLPDPKDRGHW
jgi:uncharacterized protein YidB (DUF937 family)